MQTNKEISITLLHCLGPYWSSSVRHCCLPLPGADAQFAVPVWKHRGACGEEKEKRDYNVRRRINQCWAVTLGHSSDTPYVNSQKGHQLFLTHFQLRTVHSLIHAYFSALDRKSSEE